MTFTSSLYLDHFLIIYPPANRHMFSVLLFLCLSHSFSLSHTHTLTHMYSHIQINMPLQETNYTDISEFSSLANTGPLSWWCYSFGWVNLWPWALSGRLSLASKKTRQGHGLFRGLQRHCAFFVVESKLCSGVCRLGLGRKEWHHLRFSSVLPL